MSKCLQGNFLYRKSFVDPTRKVYNKNLEYSKSEGRTISDTSLLVKTWMKHFFDTHCESLPNKDVVHLPDNYSKFEVWNIYKSTLGDVRRSANISYKRWLKIWLAHFPSVKIPTVNRFSACADCEEFKSFCEKAVTPEDKSKIIIYPYLISLSSFAILNLLLHDFMKTHIFLFSRKR